MVEAVVLTHDSNGQPSLAHLHRDPAATSGWTFTTIDTPFGGITDAAVSSSSTHNAMIMAVAPEERRTGCCRPASSACSRTDVDLRLERVGARAGRAARRRRDSGW